MNPFQNLFDWQKRLSPGCAEATFTPEQPGAGGGDQSSASSPCESVPFETTTSS